VDKWTFSSESDCADFIVDSMVRLGMGDEISRTIAEQIAPDCIEKASCPDQGFGLIVGNWVVRQEDLEFFEVLKTAAALGVVVFLGSALAGPIAAAFCAAAQLAWNAWRKGCLLSPLEVRILHELSSCRDGLTISQLHERISVHGVPSLIQVRDALERLANLVSRSGKIELIVEDATKRWHSVH
jgi:hypothetical protein